MSAKNWSEVQNKIKDEISALVRFIDKTRKGIDTLENTVKIGSERFPEASSQLAAVTGDLENAANNIMSILEGLMQEQENAHALLKALSGWAASAKEPGQALGLIGELEKINERTKKETMDIFTNMSFHDLSGQKLKKVIGSLAVVESKLLEMALSFGLEGTGAEDGTAGPEAKESAPIKQDVVDKLLKELGA
ncbi:MAG: protein phosphatase CheZ [Deltaproteobacteria bacterium]|nr:protein phosphatase CheZ [Deltaproteobacteria bacterium]